MEDAYGYERYKEPYGCKVRDQRVRIARGLQAVDGLQTSEAFDAPAQRYVEGEIGATELREIIDKFPRGLFLSDNTLLRNWVGAFFSLSHSRFACARLRSGVVGMLRTAHRLFRSRTAQLRKAIGLRKSVI